MRYERPEPISREEAIISLASEDPHVVAQAIIRLALNSPDRVWVEQQALWLTSHRDPDVRAVAATALGHLARIHGAVDHRAVVPALERLKEDPETVGRAEDALSDISIFAPPRGPGS
jgi:hypothetical protein